MAPDIKTTATIPQTVSPSPQLSPSQINQDELFSDTNIYRTQVGLASLTIDDRLNQAASAKCADMVKYNYWSHTSPDQGGYENFLIAAGLPKIHFGENLAEGQLAAIRVIHDWMNSDEHKANILEPDFTSVGFAVCESRDYVANYELPTLITVQDFAEL